MRIMTCTSCSYIFLCLNLHWQKCYRCWIYGLSPWLVLGWILLLLLAQHFPFLLFLSFSVHTAATTRDEWIHGRRTKKSRSYSVWNGKRGTYHMNTFFSPKSLANICAGTLQKSLVFLLFVVEADQTRKNTNKCFFEAEVWEVWWTCSRGETI